MLKAHAIPVGAGVPANTGEAGAMPRVAGFAGTPAPTRIAQVCQGLSKAAQA